MILVEVVNNHTLGENTFYESHMGWGKYKIIIVLKPPTMYQIIQQSHKFKNILIDGFQHDSFPYQATFLWASFMELKIANSKDKTTIQTFIW